MGAKLMQHRRPEDRIYTVISGVFYIGVGEKFDGDKVDSARQRHRATRQYLAFPRAKSGEYVSQVNAMGPLGLEYEDPGDDPRRQGRSPPPPSMNLLGPARTRTGPANRANLISW